MALILTFVVLLLLGLWMVGARNRLVRLRQAVGAGLAPLELQLRKRQALSRHLAEAMQLTGQAPRELTEALKAAAQQATAAVDAAHARPAAPAPLRQLAAAEDVVCAALLPLMPGLASTAPSNAPSTAPEAEPPPSITGDTAGSAAAAADVPETPDVAELRARIAQLHAPLDYARQAYNGHVQHYNTALRQFPTTLVAALFRFEAAAMLPRLSRPQ